MRFLAIFLLAAFSFAACNSDAPQTAQGTTDAALAAKQKDLTGVWKLDIEETKKDVEASLKKKHGEDLPADKIQQVQSFVEGVLGAVEMHYKGDGSLVVQFAADDKIEGSWALLEGGKYLETKANGAPKKQEIISLSSSKLVILSKENEEEMKMTYVKK